MTAGFAQQKYSVIVSALMCIETSHTIHSLRMFTVSPGHIMVHGE